MKQERKNLKSADFEREPVPDHARLGLKSFVGMYAGEHCAGTELMIGPLFVAAGVSAFDLLLGLLLGNALAVLSWMVITAPIATRVRLTLYYHLEQICGTQLVKIYNLANGVMFCFLAGAMVTVSTTAVGTWLNISMPGLNDLYPNSIGWVVVSLVVGVLIAIVAAYGYRIVAEFANIAAPWMVLVFVVFGIVGLKQFLDLPGVTINSASDLWDLTRNYIWKGGAPLEGQVKFTFWHVTFFSWFCNIAMHMGMADLSIFRFAKKSWYGISTAAGMYVGHYLAWIAAAILYSYQIYNDPAFTKVIPGLLARNAAGWAGIVCVIIAGWTTANPTIYRAGLAFQAIVPKRSRFRVTFITGLIAAVAGMFPAIAMKLLDFVSLYGMLIMPMGAVMFVDYWLLKKANLHPMYAKMTGKSFYLAPGLAWILTLILCVLLIRFAGVQIYFVSLPGWLFAGTIYFLLSYWFQKNTGSLRIK